VNPNGACPDIDRGKQRNVWKHLFFRRKQHLEIRRREKSSANEAYGQRKKSMRSSPGESRGPGVIPVQAGNCLRDWIWALAEKQNSMDSRSVKIYIFQYAI
jgi:hypothetical protein